MRSQGSVPCSVYIWITGVVCVNGRKCTQWRTGYTENDIRDIVGLRLQNNLDVLGTSVRVSTHGAHFNSWVPRYGSMLLFLISIVNLTGGGVGDSGVIRNSNV